MAIMDVEIGQKHAPQRVPPESASCRSRCRAAVAAHAERLEEVVSRSCLGGNFLSAHQKSASKSAARQMEAICSAFILRLATGLQGNFVV